MKICTVCKTPKELGEFNKNKVRKDGHSNVCRICSNKISKGHYNNNIKEHRINTRRRTLECKTRNRKFLYDLLINSNGCIDCGNKDIRVLEFDHLHSKFKDISLLVGQGYSIEVIKSEIEKCELVCCNCHRIRTLTRLGSYRIR